MKWLNLYENNRKPKETYREKQGHGRLGWNANRGSLKTVLSDASQAFGLFKRPLIVNPHSGSCSGLVTQAMDLALLPTCNHLNTIRRVSLNIKSRSGRW